MSSVFDVRVSIHAMYYRIACLQADTYRERDTELAALGPEFMQEDLPNRREVCYEERERAAVIAITFSGMAVEAFLYDYAAEKLGDQHVKEHLDRLDVKTKFLRYPQLVCGRAPDKSCAAYLALKKLVSLRNELVHFKSESFATWKMHKASDFHTHLNDKLKAGVSDSVACVLAAVDEIDRLHGGGTEFRNRMEWGGVA